LFPKFSKINQSFLFSYFFPFIIKLHECSQPAAKATASHSAGKPWIPAKLRHEKYMHCIFLFYYDID